MPGYVKSDSFRTCSTCAIARFERGFDIGWTSTRRSCCSRSGTRSVAERNRSRRRLRASSPRARASLALRLGWECRSESRASLVVALRCPLHGCLYARDAGRSRHLSPRNVVGTFQDLTRSDWRCNVRDVLLSITIAAKDSCGPLLWPNTLRSAKHLPISFVISMYAQRSCC